MSNQNEIIKRVNLIYEEIKENKESIEEVKNEVSMFELISEYNQRHENKELIGGKWVRENISELSNLP
ncbi:hypothetical protein [Lentibacillus salicampi]|uniref:Uncharacterized protein n=1 Tax=Lentibacillus salicampi TaxID=175306 RepID=A0A4Y9A9Y4_9BACI|nr:hypothetical protein [Lentibacillus salicampi]TFJ92132.1 hypothetical protein E4U82_13710 [Lentibacillus salicampi]